MIENRSCLRVGPAGNSQLFYDEGHQQTAQAFAWQRQRFSLDAFELPFGRGTNMSLDTAGQIGRAARADDVALSAHAPYYINLANTDQALAEKSVGYILDTARLLNEMGGTRVVVHVGSPKAGSRLAAMARCADRLLEAREALKRVGLGHIRLCLETMGRPGLLGTFDEILELVRLDGSFLPCLDFAHLHAISGGGLNSGEDFAGILDRLEAALGADRARQAHMHFSRIEYGVKGEIRHRTFAEEGFGPDFNHLAPLLVSRGYCGTLICESRGTMAEDAAAMKAALAAQMSGNSAAAVCKARGM